MLSVKIDSPPVPYWGNIPWNISPGKDIIVKGVFPPTIDRSSYGAINLCQGSKELIALHISIRFNYYVAVRNTFRSGKWESEEREGPFPFQLGSAFWIKICVKRNAYQILVNGQRCWTYRHRMPYTCVNVLDMSGPFQIHEVEYVDHNKIAVPYHGNIPGNIYPGKVINIKGAFPPSIDRSKYGQINLCQGSEDLIALHISIRFNFHVVVRNTFRNGRWETEEREGSFPFQLGLAFWVQIVVQQDAYHISVNGQKCWTFRHRLPYNIVNILTMDGPFQIHQVEFLDQNTIGYGSGGPSTSISQPASYQPHIPQPTSYQPHIPQPTSYQPPIPQPPLNPNYQGTFQPEAPFLQPVFNPYIPFNQLIPGGIKPGMMIYMSGMPSPNFLKFTVNLQCSGASLPPPDIAFQFDVRAFNRTVVRNTRRGNQWGEEEVAIPSFPFQSCVPFDMIVLIQSDKYMVAVNGQHFIEYRHRMTHFSAIDTFRIVNDVKITSIRYAR